MSRSIVPGRIVLLLAALALVSAQAAEAKSHDGCSGKKGALIGAGVGAVLGAGLLLAMGGKKSTQAAVAIAAVGAGALVGRSIDKRKCRMKALAESYHLDMQVEDIALADAQADFAPPPAANAEPAGLYVSLRDDGRQFATGSDQLTPNAAEYFGKMADDYQAKTDDAGAANRVIVLIGHTDDVGDSASNADLSERRARTVAQLFRDHGIADANLFFQGAGETLPIDDNRTDAGRARNRRVEIVDLPNAEALAAFLNRRLPRIENYRPAETEVASTAAKPSAPPPATRSAPPVREAAAHPVKPVPRVPAATVAIAANDLDFGGHPAKLVTAPDIGPLQQAHGISAIFSSPARAATLDGAGLSSCTTDRPRRAYAVKSLRSGQPLPFGTGDYMTGLYDTSWSAMAGNHLVALTHVTVLRDGGKPAAPPSLKVYANYDAAKARNAVAAVDTQPQVNVYRGQRGVLYRVFAGEARNLRCIDMVVPAAGGFTAPDSKLVYAVAGQTYQAGWAPRVVGK